ncbi:MAG TPA: SIMPL domain-containing protein [Symbiobacteriaceae bacterium]|nr:SIMPL domain-containing protein [Symbiobacteriaceae bacterium]
MNLLTGMAAARQPSVLTVTGEGSVQVTPDTAVITLGVTARAPQAASAFQQAANALNQVVRALLAAGVPRDQIQTSQVSLQPAFENGRQMGFEATATVRVTVRDFGVLGGLIDRAVAAGANNVAGISFEVQDQVAAEAAAIAAAVQNARAQAVVLARSLGIPLGPVFRVEAEPAQGPPVPLFAARAVAAGEQLPVLPGTQTITRRVRVEFLIGR